MRARLSPSGGRETRGVPARRPAGALRRRPAAIHAPRPARERPPPRGRCHRRRRRHRGGRRLERGGRAAQEINFTPARVLLQDFTGVPAVVDLAAMRAAMADLGGDPQKINPLIPVELVIDHSVQVDDFADARSRSSATRARVQPQQRALRLPALGPGRVRELQGRAPEHRHLPPGQPRVPRACRRGAATARRSPTRSSAPTRTRRWSTGSACSVGASAGSRPRRRCWASRSRCSSRRSSASGSTGPPRGGDGHRPRTHGDPDPAPDGRRREVRRVLRPRPRRPAARRPRDDREHVPGVRRHVRLLPRRRRDAPLPAPHRARRRAGRARRGLLQGERPLARPGRSSRPTRRSSSSTSRRVEPSLAGPRRPQDRVPLREARNAFSAALPSFGVDRGQRRRSTRRSRSRWTRATRRR